MSRGFCALATSSGLLCLVHCIPSIPLGPWTKIKWVEDHDWMNSLVILRLVHTPRWVLALQLPSIWLLSVQFNLHSPLTWPVSITLALGGRYVSFTLESLLSADTVRQLQSDSLQQRPDGTERPLHPETYTCKRNALTTQRTSYKCGLYWRRCMLIDASLYLTGNRSRVSVALHVGSWLEDLTRYEIWPSWSIKRFYLYGNIISFSLKI